MTAGRGRGFPWRGWAGLLLFLAGFAALVLDVERWNAVWYLPAWYGYLLLLDAVIYRVRGGSPLSEKPREVLRWMLWSIPFWFLFEAFNLRLRNWYYVFALRDPLTSAVAGAAAFATVIPACFFHAELVRALGWWRDRRGSPLAVTLAVERAILALGVLSIAAPLAWPREAFPLVWGATLWIPELWNRRAGRPSLLADLEAGRCERPLQLLTGGLLAGVVWEAFNFVARCKWIYAVPGLEEWKVFEMPLAGFLGFPVLAVAAFSFDALVSRLRIAPASPAAAAGVAATLLAAALLSVATFVSMLERTVSSQRPVLSELRGLTPEDVGRLRALGIPTPERLDRARRRDGLDSLAARSGVPLQRLVPAARHAAMSLHKGMGAEAAALLGSAGVESVTQLASARPAELFERLRAAASASGVRPPRLAEVKVWVRAARVSGQPRR
jgi:hypothetical protein